MAGFAHRRIVLIEQLAVGKDQPNIVNKLVPILVPGARTRTEIELLLDAGQIHRVFDDLFVGGELFGVDGVQEGPGVIHRLHFGDDCRTDRHVAVDFRQFSTFFGRS